MNKIISLIGLLYLSISIYALEESVVYNEISYQMMAKQQCENSNDLFWKRLSIRTPLNPTYNQKTQGNYKLRYSVFGCSLGKKGTLLISPGRSESSPEYFETAVDFINAGYSPVYVVDHRGQGLSPRLLTDTQKGHIESFDEYISDLSYVVKQVQKDLKNNGNSSQPLFYTSNSMGSAIGIGYFQMMKSNNPFKAAALLGSQIKVNYLGVVKKDPTVFNNMLYSEAGVIWQANSKCRKGKCGDYASGDTFGGYKPENRVFNASEDNLTHSKERFELRNYIWDKFDWSEIARFEYENENWTSPILGGATYSWARAAAKMNKRMRKKRNIRKMDIPLLVLTGTRDIRAYTPYLDGSTDLSAHREFCSNVDRFSASSCSFVPLKEAFHELYKESDYYRNQSLNTVLNFFEKHK